VTHLRQLMLDELQRRNYSQSTTRCYLHAVEDFAKRRLKSHSGSPHPPQTPTAHFKRPYRNCPGAVNRASTRRIGRGSPDRDLSFMRTNPCLWPKLIETLAIVSGHNCIT
jgi:hypothetical protein